jgi:hypothetical protein
MPGSATGKKFFVRQIIQKNILIPFSKSVCFFVPVG